MAANRRQSPEGNRYSPYNFHQQEVEENEKLPFISRGTALYNKVFHLSIQEIKGSFENVRFL